MKRKNSSKAAIPSLEEEDKKRDSSSSTQGKYLTSFVRRVTPFHSSFPR